MLVKYEKCKQITLNCCKCGCWREQKLRFWNAYSGHWNLNRAMTELECSWVRSCVTVQVDKSASLPESSLLPSSAVSACHVTLALQVDEYKHAGRLANSIIDKSQYSIIVSDRDYMRKREKNWKSVMVHHALLFFFQGHEKSFSLSFS